jgi:hypothetical protein
LSTSVVFIPGKEKYSPVILGRFSPPVSGLVGPDWLANTVSPGDWILDPFGASYQTILEIASAGYRVLVTANNPITRFIIEHQANPPTEHDFQVALADLASSQKGAERIEPHIRSLYQTDCDHCGQTIEAQAFIWERESNRPVAKNYECPYCQESGEHPTTPADVERAIQYSNNNLYRMRALERVAPLNDPDREHVEKALQLYTGRAVYALISLVNKLDSFQTEQRRIITALLLAAFDQGNSLWPHPPTTNRPRSLRVPPRYLEKNLWMALEDAVQAWIGSEHPDIESNVPVPLTYWPDTPPASGGICLFEGRLKALSDMIINENQQKPEIQAVFSIFPRPNQAFWALSALWVGWLWGATASAEFKSVLRRWRYDWGWHSAAMHSVFQAMKEITQPDTPFLGIISELEAGFLSASVLAAQLAGYKLQGIALRSEENQAQITWHTPQNQKVLEPEQPLNRSEMEKLLRRSTQIYLANRGQPADYNHLLANALYVLSQLKAFDQTEIPPATLLQQTEENLHRALAFPGSFLRFGGSSSSLEIGQWWLDTQSLKQSSQQISLPLEDRLEIEVVRYLHRNPGCTSKDLDHSMCKTFDSLFTPPRQLVLACLNSYAEQTPPESDSWRMKAQDDPQKRRQDIQEMGNLLNEIGQNLGLKIIHEKTPKTMSMPHQRDVIIWKDPSGETQYRFYLIASSVFGSIVFQSNLAVTYRVEGELESPKRKIIVLPGGRARLVEYKLRLDPRLRAAIDVSWQLVKFRHLRRLAEDPNLRQENLDRSLALDPFEDRDPQLKLL